MHTVGKCRLLPSIHCIHVESMQYVLLHARNASIQQRLYNSYRCTTKIQRYDTLCTECCDTRLHCMHCCTATARQYILLHGCTAYATIQHLLCTTCYCTAAEHVLLCRNSNTLHIQLHGYSTSAVIQQLQYNTHCYTATILPLRRSIMCTGSIAALQPYIYAVICTQYAWLRGKISSIQ